MSDELLSWGRYPIRPQHANVCGWRDELSSCLNKTISSHRTTLPFGNGRSYGDSCLAASDQVIGMRSLDRFIAADWMTGIVTVEAGMTLGELLTLSVPRGWFLPVTPGTQFATVGGALANDVHGKNHHRRGTFGRHVPAFGLIREHMPSRHCSLEAEPELFAATIGGLGLTGIVDWVQLQLIPIYSNQIDTCTVRFGSLNEFFTLSEELDAKHEYSVAWIDCLAKGTERGRGVFIVGDHARYGSLETNISHNLSVPFTPPISLINNLSLKVFNSLYWHKHPKTLTRQRSAYEPFFYPLDGILHWNRIYGRKGFQQYQCVIPESQAEVAMHELLRLIAEAGQGSFLAVLKRCGDIRSPGLLSFPLPGTSLALDFPQSASLEQNLFTRMDAVVRESGGRLYPAKDAHMSGEDFRRAYPRWQQLETMRDPSLMSHFWKRMTE